MGISLRSHSFILSRPAAVKMSPCGIITKNQMKLCNQTSIQLQVKGAKFSQPFGILPHYYITTGVTSQKPMT